jgi:hypothetical protein
LRTKWGQDWPSMPSVGYRVQPFSKSVQTVSRAKEHNGNVKSELKRCANIMALFRLFFSAETIFFSHNKSTNNNFNHGFSAKRSGSMCRTKIGVGDSIIKSCTKLAYCVGGKIPQTQRLITGIRTNQKSFNIIAPHQLVQIYGSISMSDIRIWLSWVNFTYDGHENWLRHLISYPDAFVRTAHEMPGKWRGLVLPTNCQQGRI